MLRIPSIIALGAVVFLAGGAPVTADVAYLRSGETLQVSGFRLEGDFVFLVIDGGGEVALPNSQVLEIRRVYDDQPPARSNEIPPPRRESRQPLDGHVSPAGPDGSTAAFGPLGSEVLPAGAVFDQEALKKLAARVAHRHGLSSALVQAVVQVESRYDAFAVSPKGAMGLMQLMPQTATRYGVSNTFDPVENIEGGVRYLKALLERYSGETRLALAAYNAGEEAVKRYGGVPPYRETILYVDRVLRASRQ